MQLAIVAAGSAVEILAWRLVSAGRASVWGLMVGVFAAHAVVAAIVLPPIASGDETLAVALAAGVSSGMGLWAATLAFVSVAVRWEAFRRAVVDRYASSQAVALPTALAISFLVAVPGEELFWRSLAQRRFGISGEVVGAVTAWIGYVIVNVASGSLPFIAGAVVGGAVWGGLAWWTGGIAAGLASHGVWTAMMLILPPPSGRGRVEVTPG